MRPIRLIAAAAAILCLTGCALPFGILAPQQQPAASASVEVQESVPADEDADEGAGQPPESASSVPTATWTPWDVSGIQTRGSDSAECKAATKIMETATQLGLAAVTGNVTQAMSDKVFTTSVTNDVPGDALPVLDALKAATAALIGADVLSSEDHVEAWTNAFTDWGRATVQICS